MIKTQPPTYLQVFNKLTYSPTSASPTIMHTNSFVETQSYLSPCGPMVIGSYNGHLCLCDWADGRNHTQVMQRLARGLKAEFKAGSSEVIRRAVEQLDRYFAEAFMPDLPLLLVGTEFQKQVWSELLNIPYGTTLSYGELARKMARPQAVRATGMAVGANGISIFIPCHRIIGSNCSLTGYAGGLDRKRFLLQMECERTIGKSKKLFAETSETPLLL